MKSKTLSGFKFKISNKNKFAEVAKLPYLKLVYYSILLNTLVISLILFFKNQLPPEVPLYYGLPEGKSQLSTVEELIIPSMAALLVILINISIASLLQNDYLKRALIIVSLVITLLSLITTLEIVFLVGNI